MLEIFSKDLSKPSLFVRVDILRMIKTNISKAKIGKRVSAEILLKMKTK